MYKCIQETVNESNTSEFFEEFTMERNNMKIEELDEWIIVHYSDNYVEMYKKVKLETNKYSIKLYFPSSIRLVTDKSVAFLTTTHTGTSGYRASEIGVGADGVVCYVNAPQTFTATGYIIVHGFLKE